MDHSEHARCTQHGCWIFSNDHCSDCTQECAQRTECQLPNAAVNELDQRDAKWAAHAPAPPGGRVTLSCEFCWCQIQNDAYCEHQMLDGVYCSPEHAYAAAAAALEDALHAILNGGAA